MWSIPAVAGVEALEVARRLRVPLVASFHTNLPAYCARYHLSWLERPAWAYLRRLHNHARVNLCTSRPMRDMLQRQGIARLALWPPGVDTERFAPAHCAAEWRARLTGGHAERVIMLSVGRLAAEKS